MALPFLIGLLLFPLAPGATLPLWAFLGLIVAFDVAHVWATLYLAYVDGEAFARHRWLCLLAPPVCFGLAYWLHLQSPVWFWTAMAYVAIHHFASQHWGFVALYRGLGGEPRQGYDRRLDQLTAWVGALGPVLWWHATPGGRFDWFDHGEEFLLVLDPAWRLGIAVSMVGVAAVYLGRQLVLWRAGRFNPGKNAWILATWSSWSGATWFADHPLVALALVNLLHGIPFLALAWLRLRRRFQAEPAGVEAPWSQRLLDWLSRPRQLWLFYGLLLLLALGEETLWEGLIWGRYLDPWLGSGPLDARLAAFLVALLATPQTVHYLLDGFFWQGAHNPELRHLLQPAARPGTERPVTLHG